MKKREAWDLHYIPFLNDASGSECTPLKPPALSTQRKPGQPIAAHFISDRKMNLNIVWTGTELREANNKKLFSMENCWQSKCLNGINA
jgi:hypothetical protein